MNWGSIADWALVILIVGGSIYGAVAVWVNLKRTSTENAAGIKALRTEFDAFRGTVVTSAMLSEYLEKSSANALEIGKIKDTMMTIPNHDLLQRNCQANLVNMIAAANKDSEQLRDGIKEVKVAVEGHIVQQNLQFSDMLVAIASLGTKIDERTQKRGEQ